MEYTQNDTPVLKYLGWGKPLLEHPDFRNRTLDIMLIKDNDNARPHDRIVNRTLTENILRDWPALATSFRKNIRTVDTALFRTLMKDSGTNPLAAMPVRTSLQGTLLTDGLTVCYDMMVTNGGQPVGTIIVLQGKTLRLVCSGNTMRAAFASRDIFAAEPHVTPSELTERLSRAVAAIHLMNKEK